MTDDVPCTSSSPGALLKRHGLLPKKAWGQCFLHDPRIVEGIVRAAEIAPGDTVVEIGAGLGALTAQLATRAARVVAIERDRDLARVLRLELGELPNLEVVEENALTYAFEGFAQPVVVVGNLPYHISSQLLFHLLDEAVRIRSATVMLQRELADRLVSPPGSRVYGAASVMCQHRAEVRRCLKVGRGAFVPVPRVDSTVIQLRMRPVDELGETPALLSQVVHAAFGQRRKTLQRALGAAFPPSRVQAALEGAGIDGKLRAERLDVDAFVALARAFERADGGATTA